MADASTIQEAFKRLGEAAVSFRLAIEQALREEALAAQVRCCLREEKAEWAIAWARRMAKRGKNFEFWLRYAWTAADYEIELGDSDS